MGAFLLQLRSFARSSLRQPAFAVLAVLGVMLGVSVVTGVDRAIDASRRNLQASMTLLSGPYGHHVVGGADGIDEGFYRELRVELGIRDSLPVVDGAVRLGADGNRYVRIVGVDVLAGTGAGTGAVPAWLQTLAAQASGQPLLGNAGAVALAGSFAERLGVARGDTLEVGDRGREARVAALVEVPPGQAGAWDGLLLADIATAQDLLDRRGRLTRIDLRAAPADLERIEARLPGGAELLTSRQRSENLLGLTQSFHLNLTALSLLSLLVGAMLIFNTETFLVVRRKRELAILRSMGVTSRGIFSLVMAEALALGLAGSIAGIAAGSVLAQVMMELIGRTSADLYATVSSTLPPMEPLQTLRLLLIGVGVSFVAAWLPAREAVRGATVEQLRNHELVHDDAVSWPRVAAGGVLAAALGVLLLLLTPRQVAPAFAALFLVLLGFTAQAPLVAQRLFGRSRGATRSLPALAVRGVGSHLNRSAPALAALIVALGTSLGISLMIASFEDAVVDWLDQVLQADFYVAGRQPRVIDGAALAGLRAVPGVSDLSTVRWTRIETGSGYDRIVAYDLNERAEDGFRLLQGDAGAFWASFRSEPVVMITETLAYKRDLGVGDTLTLRTARGEDAFSVGAVYRDYGSEHGTIAMSRQVYDAHFPPRETVDGVGVYLAPDADRRRMAVALEAWAADLPDVELRSRESLIDVSLEVFSRTFTITEVLRVLAALVAFAGTINALLALLLDRYSQFAVLRAIGVTPNEVAGLLLAESGLLGLFAGIFAVPAGILISMLLIFVVNVRSFGWTMPPAIEAAPLAGTVLLSVTAALLAAVWPAWRLRQRFQASDLAPRRA